jgi:hypothetical protein
MSGISMTAFINNTDRNNMTIDKAGCIWIKKMDREDHQRVVPSTLCNAARSEGRIRAACWRTNLISGLS